MKAKHVVLDYTRTPGTLVCKHCGKRQVMPEDDIPISIFVSIMQEFTKLHKNCKNSNAEEGDGFDR
jgi:hypothetical protein